MKTAYAQANDTVNAANKQAQDILDSAQADANNIRTSAISYTDELLSNISSILGNTIAEVGEKYGDFSSAIQSYYDLVNQNRSELSPMESSVASVSAEPADDYEE